MNSSDKPEMSLFSEYTSDITSCKMKTKGGRKGFTLVELIVVLVILAILAAILIPSMTGWIDKARATKAIAEANEIYQAAQSAAAEQYAEYNGEVPGDGGHGTGERENYFTTFKRKFGQKIYEYIKNDLPDIYGVFDGNELCDLRNNGIAYQKPNPNTVQTHYFELAVKYKEYYFNTNKNGLKTFAKCGKSVAKIWFNLTKGQKTGNDFTAKAIWYIDSTGTYCIKMLLDPEKGGPITTYEKVADLIK